MCKTTQKRLEKRIESVMSNLEYLKSLGNPTLRPLTSKSAIEGCKKDIYKLLRLLNDALMELEEI